MPEILLTLASGIGGVIIGFLLHWWSNSVARKNTQKQQVDSFRQAIYAEVSSFWDEYMVNIGNIIEEHDTNEPFLFYFPITQSYFSIFDNNAAMLGLLPNKEERLLIIKLYTTAKGMVDSYIHNNSLISGKAMMSQVRNMIPANQRMINLGQIDANKNMLADYAKKLKERHDKLKFLKHKLLSMLESSHS